MHLKNVLYALKKNNLPFPRNKYKPGHVSMTTGDFSMAVCHGDGPWFL